MFHFKYKVVPQHGAISTDEDLLQFSVSVEMEVSICRLQDLPPRLEVVV